MFAVGSKTNEIKMTLGNIQPSDIKFISSTDMVNRFPISESIINLLAININIEQEGIDVEQRFDYLFHVIYGNVENPENPYLNNVVFGIRASLLVTMVHKLEEMGVIPESDIEDIITTDSLVDIQKTVMNIIGNKIKWPKVSSQSEEYIQAIISICAMLYYQNYGLNHFYRLYLNYINDTKLAVYFKKFGCPVFLNIINKLNPETRDSLLVTLDLQNETSLAYIPKYHELSCLQHTLKLTYSYVNLIKQISGKTNTINGVIFNCIRDNVDSLLTLEDKKSQKIRTAQASLMSKVENSSVLDEENNLISILYSTLKIATLDDNIFTVEKLKEEMKSYIDASQFDSVKSTIDKIEKLKSRSIEAKLFQINKMSDAISEPRLIINPFEDRGNKSIHITSSDDKLLLELAEEEIREKSIKLTKAHDTISILENEVDALKLDITTQRKLTKSMNSFMYGKPSILDAYNCIKELYPSVIFNDDIENQIANCKFNDARKLFRTLDLIVGEYYQSIINGNPDSVAKNVFSCSGYSQDESKSVRNSKTLYSKRIFTVNGEKVQFGRHFTLGGDMNIQKTVQIYFDIIKGNMVIGYIGKHLPLE